MFSILGFNLENQDSMDLPGLMQYISPEKQDRIKAYKYRSDAQRVLIGDLLIRAIACRRFNIKNNELQFQTGRYGKPYLKGAKDFCYNLSHSGKWVVCAVDSKQVGVDIEKKIPIDLNIAYQYFSKEEIAYILGKPEDQKTAAFFDIWTCKESYIKALGCGLSKDLNSFTVKIINDDKAVVTESIHNSPAFLRRYRIDNGYRLFVCAFNKEFPDKVETVDINWILDVF